MSSSAACRRVAAAIFVFLLAGTVDAIGQDRLAPFPPIGGGRTQVVLIHVVALGAIGSACPAALSFRSIPNGDPVGPSEVVNLRFGEAKTISLRLDSLGIGAGERAEVQPLVELGDASCFASVELTDILGREIGAFVSGSTLAPSRLQTATDSPFVEARQSDSVQLIVARLSDADSPPCDVHLGFRDDAGKPVGPQDDVSLTPGSVRRATLKLADSFAFQSDPIRILLDIRPTVDAGAGGCVAAAQVYDTTLGLTVRYFPIAVPTAIAALAVPPPPQPRTDPPQLPPIGGPVPIGQPVTIRSPLGLPALVIPPDNPPTAETIALGRRLFYDNRLSVDGSIACASCHDPAAAFSDTRRLSLGVNGSDGERHSMSVVNAALSQDVFWDGRSAGLEAQAREPVRGGLEFAHSLEGAEKRLQSDSSYVAQFEAAFGPGPIVYDMAAKAIASFQRTLLSGNSPFDRFFFKGDRNAISISAQRGLNLFRGGGGCANCHLIEGAYATFGNTRFFNTGVAATSFNTLQDQGRWKVTQQETDRGAFRPPSLRNVALRAPYMHDGSIKTLFEVVQFYAGGARRNLWLSPEIGPPPRPGAVLQQDLLDLEEFLRTLTGELPENAGPPDGLSSLGPPSPK